MLLLSLGILAIILTTMLALIGVKFKPIHSVIIPDPLVRDHDFSVAVANFQFSGPAPPDSFEPLLKRDIPVSLFIPVKREDCTKQCEKLYMPAEDVDANDEEFFGDLNAGIFKRFKYEVCCGGLEIIDAFKYPNIILEPQAHTSRFLYSTLARFLSANGMAVVLLENARRRCTARNCPDGSSIHQHDSSITHKDTSITHHDANMTDDEDKLNAFTDLTEWNTTVSKVVETRIADIFFALEQLQDVTVLQRQFPFLKFNSTVNTKSYTIIGHGMGGTVATTLGTLDPRVRFSINLSGSAPFLLEPTSASVYFFGRSDFRREHDIYWPATWPMLQGKATEWDLQDAGMFDYSDLPWIVDLARQDGKMKIGDVKGLKTLGPNGFHIMTCFIESYIRAELMVPKDSSSLSQCVNLYKQMVPYMADPLAD